MTFAEITTLANKAKDEARRAGFSEAAVESILLISICGQVEATTIQCPPAEVQRLHAWLKPNPVEVA